MSLTPLAADKNNMPREESELKATDYRIGVSGDLKMAL